MDADIEYLLKIFELPRIQRALSTLRAAVPTRGDLELGDEHLMIYQVRDSELISFGVRIEIDDTRSEFEVALNEQQLEAAELLWCLGIANAEFAKRTMVDSAEFLASQAGHMRMQLGAQLNAGVIDHLAIYPGPLSKP